MIDGEMGQRVHHEVKFEIEYYEPGRASGREVGRNETAGIINRFLRPFDLSQPPIQFINTFSAILIAHVFYNTTIVLRMVGDYWSHIDPRMGQAAQVLGAKRMQTLLRVILPLLMPVIRLKWQVRKNPNYSPRILE